jgi:hypothetical protein
MTQTLIEFLKELVREMENDEMEPFVYKELGEFYVKLRFLLNYKIKPMEDDDIIKYLSLGYYIYTNIDLESSEPSPEMVMAALKSDEKVELSEPQKQ